MTFSSTRASISSFSNFDIVSTQFLSERAFRWGSGRDCLEAIPNWQCVFLQKMLLIAFRGEKICLAVYTITIRSHVMCQLVPACRALGLPTNCRTIRDIHRKQFEEEGERIFRTFCSRHLNFLLELSNFPYCWQGTGIAVEVEFDTVC